MYYTAPKKKGIKNEWTVEVLDDQKRYTDGTPMVIKIITRTTKKDIMEYIKSNPV